MKTRTWHRSVPRTILAIALGVLVIAVTVVFFFPDATGARKQARTEQVLTEVAMRLKEGIPANGSITTSKLIAEGVIPDTLVTDGKITNAWGGVITVADAPLFGVRSGGFSITANKVPRDECSALVASLQSQYDVVVVGWTKLKDVQDGTQFSAGAALGACNNESNEVTFSASRPR